MSRESDLAYERWRRDTSGPIPTALQCWNAALDWSRPLVAAAIAKAKQSRKQKSESGPYSGTFLEFWRAYPTGMRGKSGKATAFKVWKRMHLDSLWPDILNALVKARRCEQWQKDGGQFIPNPATWLNRRGWEDELHGAVETQSEVRRAPVERSPEETEFYRRLNQSL